MQPHNEMSIEECQDYLAIAEGWEFKHNSWWHPTIMACFHPYADQRNIPNALPSDWIFDALTELRGIENPWRARAYLHVKSTLENGEPLFIFVTAHGNTEYETRARLAVAAHQANRKRKAETDSRLA